MDILNAIKNKINDIRDDVYAVFWGFRFVYHVAVFRDTCKGIDDLFKFKKYFIKHYGKYTIYDHQDVLNMLDQVSNNYPEFGFELNLIAKGFDLEEAETIKKEFGV